jgi:hypothetical protein
MAGFIVFAFRSRTSSESLKRSAAPSQLMRIDHIEPWITGDSEVIQVKLQRPQAKNPGHPESFLLFDHADTDRIDTG